MVEDDDKLIKREGAAFWGCDMALYWLLPRPLIFNLPLSLYIYISHHTVYTNKQHTAGMNTLVAAFLIPLGIITCESILSTHTHTTHGSRLF
jgi:hypothetical protein